eukprot:SAG22_NODE_805_length_7096_cov_28.481206_7_plen_343_part_00
MAAQSALPEGDGRVLLFRLLRSCVSLAQLAGETIRGVQRGREAATQPAAGPSPSPCQCPADALSASLKDPTDTRSYLTIADVRAQKVIVDGLRQSFPGLALVGEEDEAELDGSGSAAAALADSAQWWPGSGDQRSGSGWDGVCAAGASASELPAVFSALTLAELVVFIDPLDGTREFVQGRLHSVQTLIGLAWRGRPIAGVVGLPFHDGQVGQAGQPAASQAAGLTLHGVVGLGAFGLPGGGGGGGGGDHDSVASGLQQSAAAAAEADLEPGGPQSKRSRRRAALVCAASKTVKEPVLVKAHAIVGGELLVAGGCGNKILQLLTGEADVTLFNLGTSLWDTW